MKPKKSMIAGIALILLSIPLCQGRNNSERKKPSFPPRSENNNSMYYDFLNSSRQPVPPPYQNPFSAYEYPYASTKKFTRSWSLLESFVF